MKPGRVFWGVCFVLLGLLLLAARFDLFAIGWMDLWRFWPLVLVLIGGALLLKGTRYSVILLGLGGAALAVLLVSLFSFSWIDGEWGPAQDTHEQTFTVPYTEGIARASLIYEGGAGTFDVQGGSEGLVDATTRSSFGEYLFSVDSSGEGREIRLTFSGLHHGWRFWRSGQEADVTLRQGPAWDLDLSVGASRLDLDLSTLVVDRLKVGSGASRAQIKLGEKGKDTDVEIQAGASTIRVEVPESAGCEVRVEGALASKHFPGFEKMGNGEFRTENFDSAGRKISIAIHAGVSSIRVTRY